MKRINNTIKFSLIIITIILITGLITKFRFDSSQNYQIRAEIEISPINKQGDIRLFKTMKEIENVPKGSFNYSGAISFAALTKQGLNKAIARAHPYFKLNYLEPQSSQPGTTTGIQMLLDDRVSFAQSNRRLTEKEIALMKSKGSQLESVAIATDGITFFVNKSLKIKSLSIQQLQDIYGGKITNWQQIGGADLPITPVSLNPYVDNTLQLLYKTDNISVQDGWSDHIIFVRDYTSAIRKTNSIPGAISYGSSALVSGQNSISPIAVAADLDTPAISAILSDGTINLQAFEKKFYPLTRKLFIVISRDKKHSKVGVAYANLLLSQEGQKIIRQAGFVTLY